MMLSISFNGMRYRSFYSDLGTHDSWCFVVVHIETIPSERLGTAYIIETLFSPDKVDGLVYW